MPFLPDNTFVPLPDEEHTETLVCACREPDEPKDGEPCALCGAITQREDYCFGCKSYVCDDCDPGLSDTCGAHDVADHLEQD